MTKLSISLNHRQMFIGSLAVLIILILIFIMILLSAIYFLSESMSFNRFIFVILNNIIMNGGTTLNLISLLVLLFAFYQRFQLINSWLTNNFQTEEIDDDATSASNQDDVITRRRISKHHCKMIHKIASLHDCLVDSTLQFNRCFSFQLFSAIGSMFCINIFSTFAIYRVFVRKDYVNFYKACIQFAWNTHYAAYGLSLITLCSLITRAGKYTAVLVHKAINYIEDDDDPVIDAVSFHFSPICTTLPPLVWLEMNLSSSNSVRLQHDEFHYGWFHLLLFSPSWKYSRSKCSIDHQSCRVACSRSTLRSCLRYFNWSY